MIDDKNIFFMFEYKNDQGFWNEKRREDDKKKNNKNDPGFRDRREIQFLFFVFRMKKTL